MSPRVSVVVPIFDVAPYLEACLDSLRHQHHDDLEVVMVDDGSTDGSDAIAEEFARADPRFTLVRQANAGLGAARNTGAERARGEFLAFVDSDDVVPRRAYQTLVASLDKTGSDFATGQVRRLTVFDTRRAPFLGSAFRTTRLATHVGRDPALLVDRTAWNKLFRRAFWDEHAFRFPEGVLYEDIAVILEAHYLARAVDVVAETVYLWRLRGGGTLSITQDRADARALRDRFAAVEAVDRFLVGRGLDADRERYDRAAVTQDLGYFLNVLDSAGDEYRRLFLDLANEFLARIPGAPDEGLPAIERLKWQLVRRRALPELLEVLRFQAEDLADTPPVRRFRRWYGDYPFRRDRRLRLPARTFRLEEELAAVAEIAALEWRGESLHVEGHAYVELLGAPEPRSQTVELLVRRRDWARKPVRIRATPVHRPDLAARLDGTALDLDWAGFRAEIDGSRLRQRRPWVESHWEIAVAVRARGVSRRIAALGPQPLHPAPAAVLERADGETVHAANSPAGILTVIRRKGSRLRGCAFDAGGLRLEGETGAEPEQQLVLRLERSRGVGRLEYPVEASGSTFVSRVPVADLLGVPALSVDGVVMDPFDTLTWDAYLVAGDEQRRLALEPDVRASTAYGGTEVFLYRTRTGALSVRARAIRPVVESVEWSQDGTLRLAGALPAAAAGSALVLVLRDGPAAADVPFVHVVDEGRFSAEVDLTSVPVPGRRRPLPSGAWDLLLVPAGGGRADGVKAVAASGLVDDLPRSVEVAGRTYELGVDRQDQVLLAIQPDLALDERGRANERRLRGFYENRRRSALAPAILYDCFSGREYSDSPRGIHEELVRAGAPFEHLWAVWDASCAVPPTARPVRAGSREHFDAYARSRYVVSNDWWPRWAARRPDQVWLQTWHGAPFKRHGLLLADHPRAVREYRRALAQQRESWDRVLSPAPAATEILAASFPGGTILETGLPRTDRLVSAEQADTVAVRARLGLPADGLVVLYAPTYRDHLAYRDGYRLGPLLDLDSLAAGLPEATLLVRRHPLVLEPLPTAMPPSVLDVSDYPDASELLLAADALVTDYSSLAYDFAAMGRQVVFFTPDLQAYRDEIRGLCLDYEHEAPGPVVTTTAEAIRALGEPPGDALVERGEAFRRRWCTLADGRAASRAVEQVFSW